MPHFWNNLLVVTKDELVPAWFSWTNLKLTIHRYANNEYGIKKVRIGGGGHPMLILFDSLPPHIKEGLGDPRKVDHILEKFYKTDSEAVAFYTTFRFGDGTILKTEHQDKYIINASVIKALLALKAARITERRTKGGILSGVNSTLCSDAISFNKTLKVKYGVEHNLPGHERRFKEALNAFEKYSYNSLISAKHKNTNSRKVTEDIILFLNSMFGKDKTKPTATQIHRRYTKFLNGHVEVINNNTGEIYKPEDFKALSERTVTSYLAQWVNRIGTHAARSGDRQKLMQQYKPYHTLDKPEFAGSILSIDDRQPPFKSIDGKRAWFYNGIDLASEAFTCWVHGKDKEGLILDFYRQMVRNYAEWGLNLPYELEAEMSLNSSFTNTFLRPGAMFQEVRIEANNARGKRIEAFYRQLRYGIEKKREGWLARPFAISESNQAATVETAKPLPYNHIIDGCLRDIETWNNMPHSVHKHMSRWEVFLTMQNPDLKPTNYMAILPHLGYKTQTSCKVGIIKLRNSEYLLGDSGKVATGEKLISFMKMTEGENIDVYWLDDNEGKIIKALVFIGTQYICEAIAKPTYHRAKAEQTQQCEINREIMSSYVATIEGFQKKQKRSLEGLTILDNTPAPKRTFIMPGIKQYDPIPANYEDVEILPDLDDEFDFTSPVQTYKPRSLKDRI